LFSTRHFSLSKPEHLRWENRKKALLELLAELDADILCLQEVDNYDKFWLRELSRFGYSGTYKQRNSDSKLDGCATFYRASKFEVVKFVGLELDHVDSCQGLQGAPEFATHNVALLTLLAPIGMPQACFCVANIHLFWDPSYEGLKIAQAKAVVLAARELARSVDRPAPIVLAGDFNSTPSSEVYAFLTGEAGFVSAYASCGPVARTTMPASPPAVTPTVTFPSPSLTVGKIILAKGLNPHSPEFRPLGMSADRSWLPDFHPLTSPPAAATTAPTVPGLTPLSLPGAEPAFTNYRDIFHGTIDYIMLSRASTASTADAGETSGRCARIEVLGSLGMISAGEAANDGAGLPSSRHPSDHLPIAANLELRL
jgi:mRNA deadenylase 3'-5' endonuclease subunit Ccr4